MRPKDRLLAVCAVLTTLAVIAAFACRPGKRVATPVPTGRYSATQILQRSGPLCRALAPETGEMVLSADRLAGYLEHPCWSVIATDGARREVVRLRWYDDTGELYAASHLETREGGRNDRPLGRNEVIAAARRWMRLLGFAEQSPRWHLARSPQCMHGVWSMLWRGEGREAYVRVDGYTGSLVSSQTWLLDRTRRPSIAARGAGDRTESHHA